jgi:hypothetical protein
MNPSVDVNCGNLWAHYAYCVTGKPSLLPYLSSILLTFEQAIRRPLKGYSICSRDRRCHTCGGSCGADRSGGYDLSIYAATAPLTAGFRECGGVLQNFLTY